MEIEYVGPFPEALVRGVGSVARGETFRAPKVEADQMIRSGAARPTKGAENGS